MDVELLVVADCPSEQPANELLGRALQEAGLTGVPIRTVVVGTAEEAELLNFRVHPPLGRRRRSVPPAGAILRVVLPHLSAAPRLAGAFGSGRADCGNHPGVVAGLVGATGVRKEPDIRSCW